MSLFGLDIGTSDCKGAAYSGDGRVLAASYREYATLHPQPGWAELDSRMIWSCIQSVITEIALATAHDPITALSMSTMGEAMTPVSKDRTILGNSILHTDIRGESCIEQLKQTMSQAEF